MAVHRVWRDMNKTDEISSSNTAAPSPGDRALDHLRESIDQGKLWHIAVLETIGLWTVPDESYRGRHYRYLVDNEAFDWMLLAERLCESLAGTVPQTEKEALLFHGRFPQDVSTEEFRSLIGTAKYRAHLNFWYGVLVEEALQVAVFEEVHKERNAAGYTDEVELEEEAFRRIYGEPEQDLINRFRREKKLPRKKKVRLSEMREFTYWLFKRRILFSDPSRVASDTRKGLVCLQRFYEGRDPPPAYHSDLLDAKS